MARPDRIESTYSGSPSYASAGNFYQPLAVNQIKLADGSTKTPKWESILSNILNIGGSALSAFNPLIGLGTSLIGGLLGRNSQEEINAQNIAMQRETNQLNYQMWKEQQAHDIDMYQMQNADAIAFWNMQNEYNSPEQMRKRYEEAGFNPLLAMEGGAGTASSINQANMPSQSAPQFTAPQVTANPTLAGMEAMASTQATMASVVESINATSSAIESLKGLKIENRFKEKAINKQLNYQDEMTRSLKQSTDFATRMEQVRASMEVQQLQSQISQNILTKLQIDQQQMLNQALPQQLQISLLNSAQDLTLKCLQGDISKQELRNKIAEMYETYSRISLNKKQEELTDQKITTEVLNQNKILADTSAVQADNKVKWAVADAVINATVAEMSSNQAVANLAALKANNEYYSRTQWNGYNMFNMFVDPLNYMLEPVKGIFGIAPR